MDISNFLNNLNKKNEKNSKEVAAEGLDEFFKRVKK